MLAASLLAGASQDSTAHRKLLVQADRIVFLGDSITYNGGYVANFEVWLKSLYSRRNIDVVNLGLPLETVSGSSEIGHAGGKFSRSNLFTRLDSVLSKSKPSLIFACYGMNFGIYQPIDPARFSAYKQGIEKLKAKAEAFGATIIFITPASFAPHGMTSPYAESLDAYSNWLVSRRDDGWMVIDIHSHMQDALDKSRKEDPRFTYQKDRIHPNSEGHWVMTQPILKWFGDTPSSEASSALEVINLHKLPAGIELLIKTRMRLKRDAWLTHTGHSHPSMKDGLPLNKAQIEEKKLNKEINRLVKIAGH
ncbi:GDSL-type esterase/lipase family protein [Rubritalea sp.]|uniref:GDSL-type esterase/lipase family protein n=1 Tax=Rubritalea sp. TaxID=2109375 RepID=UPI003241D651